MADRAELLALAAACEATARRTRWTGGVLMVPWTVLSLGMGGIAVRALGLEGSGRIVAAVFGTLAACIAWAAWMLWAMHRALAERAREWAREYRAEAEAEANTTPRETGMFPASGPQPGQA